MELVEGGYRVVAPRNLLYVLSTLVMLLDRP